MVRFLHLADLHLGAEPGYLGNLAAQRGQDFLDSFARAVDFCLEEALAFVVIAGDCFDSPTPQPDVFSFALAQFKRLHQAGVPVLLVPGNHDAIGQPGSIYAQPEGELQRLVHVVEAPIPTHVLSLPLDPQPVHLYSMAWDVRRSQPPFDQFRAIEKPGFHVAVLHATLEGCQYGEAHARHVPLTLAGLAQTGMDYIALGHIHAPQVQHAGRIPVVYPGTLEGKRFRPGEEGPRNLVVVSLREDGPPDIARLPWNTRTLRTESLDLSLEAVESESELAALIRDRFSDPQSLLRLTLSGNAAWIVDVDSLSQRLSGDFFWLEIDDQSRIFDNRVVGEWQQEETIRGLFVRKMQARLRGAVSDDAREEIELALKLAVQALNKSAEG